VTACAINPVKTSSLLVACVAGGEDIRPRRDDHRIAAWTQRHGECLAKGGSERLRIERANDLGNAGERFRLRWIRLHDREQFVNKVAGQQDSMAARRQEVGRGVAQQFAGEDELEARASLAQQFDGGGSYDHGFDRQEKGPWHAPSRGDRWRLLSLPANKIAVIFPRVLEGR
jgi:hypothetical protein